MPGQGLLEASGVVLSRGTGGEGGLRLTLFLKGQGLTWASAPGAASGRVRFGGGTEPLVWGTFQLHRGRGGGLCLSGVDVADDMLPLRRRPKALLAAVHWAKLLRRWLLVEHPDDGLLANLYWNMRLLSSPKVPEEAAGWRFLWRWLLAWGLAPDLGHCVRCGRGLGTSRGIWTGEGLACEDCGGTSEERPAFTGQERRLLALTAEGDVKTLRRAFEEGTLSPQFAFGLAFRCASGLLRGER